VDNRIRRFVEFDRHLSIGFDDHVLDVPRFEFGDERSVTRRIDADEDVIARVLDTRRRCRREGVFEQRDDEHGEGGEDEDDTRRLHSDDQ
jgi:hypothetical protein